MAGNRLDPRKKPPTRGGTGERQAVGKVPPAKDRGTDRVVNSEEAGLGGGLDQAEEAQQGRTDEEIKKRKP